LRDSRLGGALLWASRLALSDSVYRHRPDFALLGIDATDVIAIEIELMLKTRARLERILRGYVRNRNVRTVR
jgi:hypothetical protein